jgi:hypothetical protein
MADQDHATVDRVDGGHDRSDMVGTGDPGAVGVPRLHARECERMRVVARLLEIGDDLVP